MNFLNMHVYIVPSRHTIPLVVVVVVAYGPVLSGNVGGVDIVNRTCPLYYIIYKVYHCIYRVHM